MTQNPEISVATIMDSSSPGLAEDFYFHNTKPLLPFEHDVLRRYLDARPNYLFVKMPEGYQSGDEMAILKRHGFRQDIFPFGKLFYDCCEMLLTYKEANTEGVEPVFSC